MLGLLGVLTAVIAIIIAFYKWKFQYWKSKGLVYIEPSIPFGNLENPFLRTKSMPEVLKGWYDYFKAKGVKSGGVYLLANAGFMPVDLEYVKNIMAKDFAYFTDRGVFYDEKNDPLSAHLFAIGGVKWRNLRIKLSPTFTSGRMRTMFNTIVDCSKLFEELMDKLVDNGEAIDIKDATSRFTTDVIGSCAFGLECHTIAEPDSPFTRYGKKIFERSKLRSFTTGIAVTYPTLGRAFGYKFVPEDVSKFFMDLVKTTVEYREKNDYRRNDFLQILVDLKNNKLDDEITEKHDGRNLTIEEVAAQCFVFYVGGFETSSTLMSFALFELARNQEEQDKLREEVKNVLKIHDGQITYDAMAELKYMQQVLDETLRLYPPVGFLTRECVKDYKIPDDDVIVEKGTRCWISVYGIHHDEEYYPNPEKFDPERFSEENRHKIPHYAFLPFGEGPRICIGMRFGYMQAKVGLTCLLRKFRFSVDSKTQVPLKIDPGAVLPTVKGGIWLRAEKI